MESHRPQPTQNRQLRYWHMIALGGFFTVLAIWSWQKWNATWIQPSEAFFPPAWQHEAQALAWKYPIYRSNDTYQWVFLADSLAAGNALPLRHRSDEGTIEGRENRWHSGLARMLHLGGSAVAITQDWPISRGIHHLAHWLGSVLHIIAILLGSYLISRLNGWRSALLFAGLYFFNAAISWDFAFSRLDHEAPFQVAFLLQALGLVACCHSTTQRAQYWALMAGIAAGICWWISATMMSALSIFITIGLMLDCYLRRETDRHRLAKAVAVWGGSASAMILLFCLMDSRLSLSPSIATLHPVFIVAQIGATLVCLSPLLAAKQRLWALAIGMLCALCPVIWLLAYSNDSHPWLNPMMRRLHSHIVEFQSPFTNGLWSSAESLQAGALTILALSVGFLAQKRSYLLGSLLIGLLLLAIIQTRWLGLLGSVGIVALCLQLKPNSVNSTFSVGLGLLLLCAASWTHKWTTLQKNPGPIFMTDLFLQVGARDINLNLQSLSQGRTIQVAMPYAFAATSALFPEIKPLGTFYWENAEGIRVASDFFTGQTSDAAIDFVVVQGGRQGAPFAKLATWVALNDDAPSTIGQSLAWQFSSTNSNIPGWQEQPYQGTLSADQFSVRIFERSQ